MAKRAGNEERAHTAPQISSGGSRPLKNRVATPCPPQKGGSTPGQIIRPISEKAASSVLCCVGRGRELVWHHVASHSGSLIRKVRNHILVKWTGEAVQVFVQQKVTQHRQFNVNRLRPHQSDSVHFPDATNKGTHSLSVYYTMTTEAFPSFLLRDASRHWRMLNYLSETAVV